MTGTCRRMLLFGSCVWVRPVCRRNTACFGCSVVRLLGGTDGTGGAVARRIAVSGGAPVAVRWFCAVPGLNPLSEPAFRTRFPSPLSGSAFRVHFPNPPFGPAFRVCFGLVSGLLPGLFRDLFPERLPDLLPDRLRSCFRACFPDLFPWLFPGCRCYFV